MDRFGAGAAGGHRPGSAPSGAVPTRGRLRTAIRSGRLEPGEKLPSSRELPARSEYLVGSSPSATSSCRVRATCAVRSDRQPGSPLPRQPCRQYRRRRPPNRCRWRWTSSPASLTWPASPARTGCGPNGRRSDRHPPTPWATETQPERRSCAPSWPPMSAESAQPTWTRARC